MSAARERLNSEIFASCNKALAEGDVVSYIRLISELMDSHPLDKVVCSAVGYLYAKTDPELYLRIIYALKAQYPAHELLRAMIGKFLMSNYETMKVVPKKDVIDFQVDFFIQFPWILENAFLKKNIYVSWKDPDSIYVARKICVLYQTRINVGAMRIFCQDDSYSRKDNEIWISHSEHIRDLDITQCSEEEYAESHVPKATHERNKPALTSSYGMGITFNSYNCKCKYCSKKVEEYQKKRAEMFAAQEAQLSKTGGGSAPSKE